MATFNLEKADKDALSSIEEIEAQRLQSFKVAIRHETLANKPEDEDELIDEDGKPNGPQNLAEELQVKKNFRCLICKNIPIAPVVQCKSCEQLYCGAQCLEQYKKAIEEQRVKKEEEAAKAEAERKEAEAEAKREEAEGQEEGEAEAKEEGEAQKEGAEPAEAPKEEVVPEEAPKTEESGKRGRRRRNKGAAKLPALPEILCCLNKKCKKANFDTQPLGRIIRNIMCTFEFEYDDEIMAYQNLIKHQKQQFKDCQVYSCPYGCDTEQPLSLKKEDMKEHILNDCQNFVLKCSECSYEYKRCEFYDTKKHNCICNLMEQIENCNKEIKDLKVLSEEESKENLERKKKIDVLEAKHKELNEQYQKLSKERQKHENKNYDLFSSRHTYQNHSKMKLKIPKNFVNTLENSKEGKLLDGPIFMNLARKKKGDSWKTTAEVELVFKRKIAFNAYSFQFWTGEPPKVEEEKVEEQPAKKEEGVIENGEKKEEDKPEEEQIQEQPAVEEQQQVEEEPEEEIRPGNRANMYVYCYNVVDGKDSQISYQHFNNVAKEPKPVSEHNIKWRDCGAVITDHIKLKFMVHNDLEREQFEKLLVTDFNFYF